MMRTPMSPNPMKPMRTFPRDEARPSLAAVHSPAIDCLAATVLA